MAVAQRLQPIGQGSIQDIDGNVMTYQQEGKAPVTVDLGVPCKATGFINIYELGKIYTLSCLACMDNPAFDPEISCQGCKPEGDPPPSISDTIRKQRAE